MSGLMEQVKPENKRYYDISKFNLEATRILAANIRHLLMTERKLLFSDFIELSKLIESEDVESVRMGIYLMEAKSNINFTTKEDGNLG